MSSTELPPTPHRPRPLSRLFRSKAQPSRSTDDSALIGSVRAGDEAAFVELVRRYNGLLLRIARVHVSSSAVAEEVVQETWLAVINGIDRFEGRSSLKTWIIRIVTNQAISRGEREGRVVPFSALAASDATPAGPPSVRANRFRDFDEPEQPYHWTAPPREWPHERLLAQETRDRIAAALETLPLSQRTVISLRDIEGWTARETCEALDLSDANQRVLLHRARAAVRAALEHYFAEVAL